jgi:hypothetical protein
VRRVVPFILVLALVIVAGYFFLPRLSPGQYIYDVDQPGNDLACAGEVQFAVIGDFGEAGRPEEDVAALIDGWQPDFIVTVGDNNYPGGSAETIDANIGQYYGDYISPYFGQYGPGAGENRFFPVLGNHDWRAATHTYPYPQPYLDYFSLPGNERYYDVRIGPVHLFILDSDQNEPDGRTTDSIQAQWLAAQMEASDAPWKLVVLHEAPYSSGTKHGSNPQVQWEYATMGAAAVLSGHEHLYERVQRDGIPYIVNGLGGRQRIYPFGAPIEGSAVRYNQDYGAMSVSAANDCLNFSFYNRSGTLIDSETIVTE